MASLQSQSPFTITTGTHMSYLMVHRSLAMKALAVARRIIPDRHWYITNEGGTWSLVGEDV